MEKEYIYEVWALGYDKDDNGTDVEVLMITFQNPEQAIQFAKCFETAKDITDNYAEQISYFGELLEGDYFSIRVEKVDDTDPEYKECVDLLYEAELK